MSDYLNTHPQPCECPFCGAERNLKAQSELAARNGSAAESENRELRIMLAIAHAGLSLYTDDGELQDNRVNPFIDFKRDSVADIERKLHERAYARKQQNAAISDCGDERKHGHS